MSVSENPIVALAGAHTGTIVRSVLDTIPGSLVLAFECDPLIFAGLNANFQHEARVSVIEGALYSRDGDVLPLLTRNGVGSQSTLYKPTDLYAKQWPGVKWGRTLGVRSVTLATWASHYCFKKVDFIQLDVECAELDALEGARELLFSTTVLRLEVSVQPLCEGAPLWPQVAQFLDHSGFRVMVLPEKPWGARFDVTAVRLMAGSDV